MKTNHKIMKTFGKFIVKIIQLHEKTFSSQFWVS
jgi:hypothetical protein